MTLVFESITAGAFAFFTGDLLSFTVTAELFSLALATFHLARLLVFLCELRLGCLELLVILLLELELVPVEDSCR